MIDLHSHLLPGIDDGAVSLEEAVAMCRRAAAEGCTAMVATPHQRHPNWWNADSAQLHELRRQLQEAVGTQLAILPGAEIHVDSALLDDLHQLRTGPLLPLAGTRYVLVEFARSGVSPAPEGVVHELVVAGWRPLLAHPELLPWLAADHDRLAHLVTLGARLQLTGMSFTGGFGARPRQAAEDLVDAGLAHVVASDAHGLERRPPGLQAAFLRLSERWDEGLAWALTRDHPAAVLADEPLPAAVWAAR